VAGAVSPVQFTANAGTLRLERRDKPVAKTKGFLAHRLAAHSLTVHVQSGNASGKGKFYPLAIQEKWAQG